MEFAIAEAAFWESVGFGTAHWRKSVDGRKAMVHLPFAEALVPDIRSRQQVAVYLAPSEALQCLLNSPEWSDTNADA